MSGSDVFWFCAGALTASGIAFVMPLLWRSLATARRAVRFGIASTFVVAFLGLALGIYLWLGTPHAPATTQPTAHAALMNTQRASTNATLEEATRKLATRLGREGGSDADWELLAQSYEYAGDAAAAAEARSHRAPGSNTAASMPAPTSDWLATAQRARSERRFADARNAFEQGVAAKAMNADAWADYADVLAILAGSLRGAPAQAIDTALALEPKHTKALWLKASLAHEEHRYADAIATWRRLRSVVADSSPDARIIDANIEESNQLLQGANPETKAVASASIRGSVAIDAALAARVTQSMTLFVYAKAIDSPGPPVAVLRTRVTRWPFEFQLDDSLAMMPGRQLSNFDKVLVEARLSQSGTATAQRGDLQASGSIVSTRGAQPLALRLSKVTS